MTAEQKEIYTKTVERLRRMGVTDPTAQIIALAEEIDHYRNRIIYLENKPTEAPAVPAGPPTKHRYTCYDQALDRFVIPLYLTESDDAFLLRIGMTSQRYPDCVFGRAIDKLDAYEDQEEKEKPSEGTWEKSDIPGEKYVCSVCVGACWYYDCQGDVAKSKFCPNCGAKMKS